MATAPSEEDRERIDVGKQVVSGAGKAVIGGGIVLPALRVSLTPPLGPKQQVIDALAEAGLPLAPAFAWGILLLRISLGGLVLLWALENVRVIQRARRDDSRTERRRPPRTRSGPRGFLHRSKPAILLFFLSPLFGEYLLGNLKFSELYLLPFLALLYGAGAIVIRESTRRVGRGFATMLVLGIAYSIVEEALVDQMLFNQFYFVGQAEATKAYITQLGIDAWLTVIVIGMHTIWSVCIPIVLLESLYPERGTDPWLGTLGLATSAMVFVTGSVYFGYVIYLETDFFASVPQLIGSAIIVVGLVVVAFTMNRPPSVPIVDVKPNPWLVGGTAFVASTLFMLTDYIPGWPAVGTCVFLVIAFFTVISPWPHHGEWGPLHRLALAGGGILTYAWLGLGMTPETGPRGPIDRVGSVVVVLLAISVFVLALRRVRKADTTPNSRVDPTQ